MKRDIRYIYALYSPAFPFRVKYGISESPRRRASEVAAELSAAKGKKIVVRVAAAMPSVFSRSQEGKIHDTFRMFRADMPEHSGDSEWFWWANLISCLTLCLFTLMSGSISLNDSGITIKMSNIHNVGRLFLFIEINLRPLWSELFSTWLALSVISAIIFPVDAALVVLAVFLWEIKWIALFVFFAANAAIMYF